jgi:hypothetical protein
MDDSEEVTISVGDVNHAPVAQNQSVSLTEDNPKSITLVSIDLDGDSLTYTIVSAPAHGALSGSAPNLTYTPAPNYSGADTFTFKANDGKLDSNSASVGITISAYNTAPAPTPGEQPKETSKTVVVGPGIIVTNEPASRVSADAVSPVAQPAPSMPSQGYNIAGEQIFNPPQPDMEPDTRPYSQPLINAAPLQEQSRFALPLGGKREGNAKSASRLKGEEPVAGLVGEWKAQASLKKVSEFLFFWKTYKIELQNAQPPLLWVLPEGKRLPFGLRLNGKNGTISGFVWGRKSADVTLIMLTPAGEVPVSFRLEI